ncbi:MAG: hypothetical protein K0Q97_1493 [Bacillota bacterium]|jgi:hypothetical protein|nr:hypothetical protein [Bacillota bacterium]
MQINTAKILIKVNKGFYKKNYNFIYFNYIFKE